MDEWETMPIQTAPQKTIEAWLRFHKSELCQKIDAVFVFNKEGVEVWCVVESDKNYRKLQQLFEPLERSCRIEMYATVPSARKRSGKDMEPPPGLCENQELRANLGDPYVRFKSLLEDGLEMDEIFPPNEILKQRLMAFASQTLEWNRKSKRYAMDIPELVSVVLDPAAAPDLRGIAQTVSVEHVRNLKKNLGKLRKNLVFAHPRGIEPTKPSAGAEREEATARDLKEEAERISETMQSIGQRVYRFIYPEKHTVALEDLRRPGLLESLSAFEAKVHDFQVKIETFQFGK